MSTEAGEKLRERAIALLAKPYHTEAIITALEIFARTELEKAAREADGLVHVEHNDCCCRSANKIAAAIRQRML